MYSYGSVDGHPGIGTDGQTECVPDTHMHACQYSSSTTIIRYAQHNFVINEPNGIFQKVKPVISQFT